MITNRLPFTARIFGTLVVLFLAVAANAQWTTPDANQNISNTNSGNVGVKTTTPEFPLQVNSASSNVLGMVTSDREGVAMKSQPVEIGGVRIHRPGTLIGKALEPLASGTGKILVLLSLQ